MIYINRMEEKRVKLEILRWHSMFMGCAAFLAVSGRPCTRLAACVVCKG